MQPQKLKEAIIQELRHWRIDSHHVAERRAWANDESELRMVLDMIDRIKHRAREFLYCRYF